MAVEPRPVANRDELERWSTLVDARKEAERA